MGQAFTLETGWAGVLGTASVHMDDFGLDCQMVGLCHGSGTNR
jgi:hypothetical protein